MKMQRGRSSQALISVLHCLYQDCELQCAFHNYSSFHPCAYYPCFSMHYNTLGLDFRAERQGARHSEGVEVQEKDGTWDFDGVDHR